MKYLIIVEFFILFNNILLLFKSNSISIKLNFKHGDEYLIRFCLNSFYSISYEPNKKFQIFNNKLLYLYNLTNPSITNKRIVIYFEDIHNRIKNHLINLLKINYNVNISSYNPDYLIYDVFGCAHLNEKYKNTIKIAILTENQIPDFNIADYAIGHSHIHFLDRYFKFPSYFINYLETLKNYDFKMKKYKMNNNKTKFCAALISNVKVTDYFRLNFINELNKYKKVDMGGKYNNNVGKVIDKNKFLSSYKFSIAMENTEGDGYISEKIVQSFISGTIPIYYGDYMFDEYINPKAFILVKGDKDMMKKIEYIKEIDNNDSLYQNILKESILIDNKISNDTIKEFYEFLLHIFEQEKNKAKRIDKINEYF